MGASNILVSGAGQLGSRHLQGLAKCQNPLSIYVQDCSDESLSIAEKRWNEVSPHKGIHHISFYTGLDSVPENVDIAIVATTAKVRPDVIENICAKSEVDSWVLEKVLAHSVSDIEKIVYLVGLGSNAWVNTPRRMMPWHREIKKNLNVKKPLNFVVKGGGWGLACNAIHFLDFVEWLTGESLQSINLNRLDKNWFESKRKGYWEVTGILDALYSGGSRVSLTAHADIETVNITITDEQQTWHINEARGLAKRSDGFEVPGAISYQSDMTANLIDSIIRNNTCDLPSLEQSAALHKIFISGMHEHWVKAGHPSATFVPIT